MSINTLSIKTTKSKNCMKVLKNSAVDIAAHKALGGLALYSGREKIGMGTHLLNSFTLGSGSMDRFGKVEIGFQGTGSGESDNELIYIESHSNDEWASIIELTLKEAQWLSLQLKKFTKKFGSVIPEAQLGEIEVCFREVVSNRIPKTYICIVSDKDNEWPSVIGLSSTEAEWLSLKLRKYAEQLEA